MSDETTALLPEKSGGEVEYGKADSKFAWITCGINFWITYFTFGVMYTNGILLSPIADDLGVKIGSVSVAFSMTTSFMFLLGVVGGYLTDRHEVRWVVFAGGLLSGLSIFLSSFVHSIWQFYITFGLLLGFGSSLVFIPSSTNLSQWFQKYRGVGLGLAFTGSSVGNLTLPWICLYIEKHYGWRVFYMILGEVMALTVMLLAIPLKRRTAVVRKGEYTIRPYLRSKIFYFLMVSSFFQSIAYLIPITYLVNYSLHHGLSDFESTIPLSFMGVANIIGRIGLGYLSDRVNRLRLFQLSLLLLTVTCALWYFCVDLISLSLFAFVYGVLAGTVISTFPAIVADYYPGGVLGAMLSLVYIARGVGYLLGNPIAGYSFDLSNSFSFAIFFTSANFAIATLTSIPLPNLFGKSVQVISENENDKDKEDGGGDVHFAGKPLLSDADVK